MRKARWFGSIASSVCRRLYRLLACVSEACPAKGKALVMKPYEEQKETGNQLGICDDLDKKQIKGKNTVLSTQFKSTFIRNFPGHVPVVGKRLT